MLTATLRKSFRFPNNIKNEVSCYFPHIYKKSVGWHVRAPYTHIQIRPMNEAVFNRSRALDRQKDRQTYFPSPQFDTSASFKKMETIRIIICKIF